MKAKIAVGKPWAVLSWFAILLLLLSAADLSAQTTTGTIVGTVTDPSGAVVAGVAVTVTNEETGLRRNVSTSSRGEYTANLLPIGRYTVEGELSGFKKAKVSGIVLQVNQTVRTDLTMQVGEVTETVEVTSEVSLVKTDRSDVGQVIEAKQVVELPLNGRNFIQLALLGTGTISQNKVDPVITTFKGGIISNGAGSNANQVTLDGIENQDFLIPRLGVRPSPDAIAEFKIMGATYSAEFGRASGANINVAIKSGTNNYHGSAFEFLRNDNLDARNFFDTTGKLPEFKQNQFGGTFGGPIIKDKTFFFTSYEGLRIIKGLTIAAIVPTDAQRAGDLSTGRPIFDPLTTRTDPATGRIIRDSFPGNTIPANRISPQARKILDLLYPKAQQQNANTINGVYNPGEIENQDQVIFRVDHRLGNNDNLWGRYAYNKNPTFLPVFLTSGLPGTGTDFNFSQQNLVIAHTKIISPTIVNDARIGYNRFRQVLQTELRDRDLISEIGIEGALREPLTWGPPNINITGMTGVGAFQFSPSFPTTNTFQYMDTLAITKGPHNIKVGADFRRSQQNGIQFPGARGVYSHDGRNTRDPTSPVNTGQAFADFLLGFPSSTSVILGHVDNDMRSLNAGFFFQDDWHIHPSVTLNLGVRYNYMPQPISARDRIAVWSERDQAVILAQNDLNAPTTATGFEGRPLRELLADWKGIYNFKTRSEAGYPRALARSDNNNIEPRLGIAWRMFGSNDTVLRAGFGRFYEIVAGNVQWNQSSNTPFSRNLSFAADVDAVPVLTLQRPFPGTGIQGAPGAGSGIILDTREPYQDNWNVTLQRRLISSTSLEVGYVGSRGVGQIYFAADFNAPVIGLGSNQLRRPHPERGGATNHVPWGYRWYDSMQVKLETRTETLSILGSYTWANSRTVGGGGINESGTGARFGWNAFGLRPFPAKHLTADDPYLAVDKGPSAIDIRHRLSVSYIWELPFGKGRRFSLAGPAEWVLGGWEFTGITTFEAGVPLPVGLGTDNLGGAGGSRPNLTGDPNKGPKTPLKWFDTSVFSAPVPIGQVIANRLDPLLAAGNAGRAPIRGPGIQNWDLGIFKNFRITEASRLQFRVEMFNAFNNVNFGNPDTTFLSPNFGRIFSAARAREIQFGLKYNF
ncbi:MAG: carboxypeptidase-like regulatory domain-containing protein [Acidobacteria bacterium]|nr:carboxypeptidase-like regulatory domain-containing protein [Acidobacteriota bacterium]MCI0725011.1 carboxypeptidase-like regulatory domain-containing protein [Acidobacteriota bacterium]